MKQKNLSLIRAFVCFALTILLAVLSLCPLATFNIKMVEGECDAFVSIMEYKKVLYQADLALGEESSTEEKADKFIESYDAVIEKIQKARYPEILSSSSLTVWAATVIAQNQNYDTPFPFGMETEEDFKKFIDEIDTLCQEEDSNEYFEEWNEKYSEWYAMREFGEDTTELEKELYDIAKKIGNSSVINRMKEDSLGYDCSLSFLDLFSIQSIFNAYSLVNAKLAIPNKQAEYYKTENEETKAKIKKEIAELQEYLSDPTSYDGITAKDFEKAILINWFSENFFDSANAERYSYGAEDVFDALIDLLKTNKGANSMVVIAAVLGYITTIITTLIYLIITLIRVIVLLFTIRNQKKFFEKSSKSFTKISEIVLLFLFLLTIASGGKLTGFGIIALVLCILGHVVCGICARCSEFAKPDALYLNASQSTGVVGVVAMLMVLLLGRTMLSGLNSSKSIFMQLAYFCGSSIFMLVQMLSLFFLFLLPIFAATYMSNSLKRVACMNASTKSLAAKRDPGNYIGISIFCLILFSILVAFDILVLHCNLSWFIIGFVLFLAGEIGYVVYTKKNCPTFTKDDRLRLACGSVYPNSESLVVAPFVSITNDEVEKTVTESEVVENPQDEE